LDIALVHPSLFPQLVPHIERNIEIYTESHDRQWVEELKYCLKYIAEEPERLEATALLESSSSESEVPPALSEEQVDAEVDAILSSNQFKNYTPEQVQLIVQGLRKRRTMLINEKDYLNAQRLENISRKLLSHGQFAEVEELQHSKRFELEQKIQEAESNLMVQKENWESLHNVFLERCREELDKLGQKHTEELSQLESEFNNPPPPNFQKYSSELLQLRRRQEASTLIKHFTTAGILKEQADALQRRENRRIVQNWHSNINDRIVKCKAKQLKEVNWKKLCWKREEREMIGDAEKEVAIAEKQVLHLKELLKRMRNEEKIAREMKKEASPGRSECNSRMEFRERKILNAKIYTRSVSRTATPRRKKKQ
jgi:uncharacterized protein YlxP (DUF503 family)